MHKYAKIIYFIFLIHSISYSILFLLFFAQNSTIEYEKIKDVWVYVYDRLSNRCSRDHGNSIISYTAFVPTMQSAHIKQPINVFFCKKCDRYFVNSEAISEYSKQHIFLRLKFKAGDTVYDRKAGEKTRSFGFITET